MTEDEFVIKIKKALLAKAAEEAKNAHRHSVANYDGPGWNSRDPGDERASLAAYKAAQEVVVEYLLETCELDLDQDETEEFANKFCDRVL